MFKSAPVTNTNKRPIQDCIWASVVIKWKPYHSVSRAKQSEVFCNEVKLPWVYWDQLDANCLVLFYYTFFTLHGTGQLTRALTCIRLHVHYMTLLRMDVNYIRNT